MDDGCFTRKSLFVNDLRSCTTCIVYVTLSKTSILFGVPPEAESGCKGKESEAYLPNFFGSFFLLFFGGRLDALLRKGGGTAKKNILTSGEPGTISSNTDAFFFKSGCKGKDFTTYPPNFSGSFFQKVFFLKEYLQAEKRAKDPMARRTKCHITRLPFPKAGAKLHSPGRTAKWYGNFFAPETILFC